MSGDSDSDVVRGAFLRQHVLSIRAFIVVNESVSELGCSGLGPRKALAVRYVCAIAVNEGVVIVRLVYFHWLVGAPTRLG